MATIREERFLMRQRGAGTRQIGDFGFDLALPTGRRSASRTPQSIRKNTPRSTRRTPIRTPTQRRPPSARSIDAATNRGDAIDEETIVLAAGDDSEGSASKRRRLTSRTTPQLESLADIAEEGAYEDTTQVGGPPDVIADTTLAPKKRKKKRSILLKPKRKSRQSLESTTSQADLPSIAEQEEVHDQEKPGGATELDGDAGGGALDEEVENDVDISLEVEVAAEQPSPRAKRKKRKSVLLKPKRKSKPSLESQLSTIEILPGNQDNRRHLSESPAHEEAQDSEERAEQSNVGSLEAEPAPAPVKTAASPGKKRKRRSILLPRKKRRSSENNNEVVGSSRSAPADQERVTEEQGAITEKKKRGRPRFSLPFKIKGSSSTNKANSSLKLRDKVPEQSRAKGRPRSKQEVPQQHSPPIEDDESAEERREENEDEQAEEDEDEYEEEASKPAATKLSSKPSTTKFAATKKSASNKIQKLKSKLTKSKATPSSKTPRPPKASQGDKLPILVQRISHVHRLNFNPDTDDPLSGPGAFPENPTPNALNVLAQICREVISKNISTLTANARAATSAADKKELLAKRAIIQKYGDDLDGRLFQMSSALDHNYALGVKIKRAEKMKKELREELMRVREKQGRIEGEMDEMRREFEVVSREVEEEGRIEEILGDLEVAVQRGRAAEEKEEREGDEDEDEEEEEEREESLEGLLMGLREVAEVASSADGRVGMLEKVRGFNRMLEEAIDKL